MLFNLFGSGLGVLLVAMLVVYTATETFYKGSVSETMNYEVSDIAVLGG